MPTTPLDPDRTYPSLTRLAGRPPADSSRPSRPSRPSRLSRLPRFRRIAALVAAARTSAWALPLSKMALFGLALVVLACIGDARPARGADGPANASSPASGGVASATLVALRETDAGADASGPRATGGAPHGEPGPASAAPPPSTSPPPPPPPPPTATPTGRATPETPVVLNDATLDDFRRLPGVGPKRALALVALRAKLGRFARVEDLLRVKGIGKTTLKRLRPLVRLDRG